MIVGNNSIDGYGKKMAQIGRGLYRYWENISNIESFFSINMSATSLKQLFTELSEVPKDGGLLGRIFGNYDFSSVGSNLSTIGQGLYDYYTKITSIDDFEELNNSITAIQSLFELAQSVEGLESLESLAEFLGSFEDIGDDCLENFLEAFTDSQSTIDTAIGDFLDLVLQVFENRYQDFYDDGEDISTNWQNGIKSTFEVAYQTGISLANQVLDALAFTVPSFGVKGSSSATQFLNGIRIKYPEAYSVGHELANRALTAIQDLIPEFAEKGRQAGEGFAEGLNEMINQATSAAESISSSVPNTIANTLDEHSPSRITEKQGMFAGEGFVIGLAKMIEKVGTVANQMSEEVGKSAKESIGVISSIFANSFEVDPTITPTVDLSNVESSAQEAVRMFNDSLGNVSVRASGVYTGIDQAVEAKNNSIIQNKDFPNGNGGNVFNFNQTNNSPKSLSRIEIYRDTRNQFSAFKRYVERSKSK